MLKELNLKTVYDSSEHDLVKDLFIPLLKNSIRYDRGVGFFSSGWLKLASIGLSNFAENSGTIRLVMSPIISKEDWDAMKKGNEAKFNELLYKALLQTTIDLRKSLEEEPLNTLAWLIADDMLNIKFSIPKGRLEGGDFHDKFAIFEDEKGDRVAIHGSYNDSVHASLNGESFSVFKSWEEGQIEYVNNHDNRFLSLWDKKNKLFDIYDIPEAVKEKIIRYRTKKRPYSIPGSNGEDIEVISDMNSKGQNQAIILRDYQQEALDSWKSSDFKGIFEMATGTGKTITSLACASEVSRTNDCLFLIVSVPYLHLIEQWQREMFKFGFDPVLCSSANPGWDSSLKLKTQDFNMSFTRILSCIVTHSTASTVKFQNIIRQIKKKSIMAIFDEMHYLGASQLSCALLEIIDYRIGLSATPQRWFDIHGTKKLIDYFGSVCFSFPLEKAIGKFLVEYQYIPHVVELTEDEFEGYCALSKRIARLYSSEKYREENPRLESLLRERSRLINNAERKIEVLSELIESEKNEHDDFQQCFSHTLFYCPPGGHSEILRLVADKGIKAREFVHKVKYDERQKILKFFAAGDIQALVAIKCLDEGVDVPATKKAFILASTTNPREFIQRRGRILRTYKGKREAIIHDFIVFPPIKDTFSDNDSKKEFKKSVLKRELPRFAEFASAAKNKYKARDTIWTLLGKINLLYLMDKRPWEIYEENFPEYLDSERMEVE